MRDRSAFVPCIPVRSMDRHLTESVRTSLGIKALRSLVRGEFYWVASAAASAALRTLPRYLPWLRRDALHPSAPDATRVARLNQCFPSTSEEKMPKTRIAIIGLGMAVAPHAKSAVDLADRVDVAYAFSPSADRRAQFAQRFPLPQCDRIERIL